jgi:hypothetical protein
VVLGRDCPDARPGRPDQPALQCDPAGDRRHLPRNRTSLRPVPGRDDGLTIWSWISENRRQEARLESGRRQRFAVAKAIEELEPSDFGFQVVRHGDRPDPRYRPYYDEYISREAVPYDQIGLKEPTSVYDEDAIKDALREGKGFVLLGQPLDGKTRMLYEVVRRLPEYWVVRPGDTPTPSEAAFEIFEGRRVVFVLDDLNGYTQGIPDLKEFAARLDQRAISWAVAATCRDGSELGAVRDALGTSLRRFFEDIPLKLGLVPLTPDEKGRLARGVGKKWTDIESEHFPTPGAITMEEPLVFIREGFNRLLPSTRTRCAARSSSRRPGFCRARTGGSRRFWRRSSDEPFSWETASMF